MAFFLRSLQRPMTNLSRGLLLCQKPTTSYRFLTGKGQPKPKSYMTWRSFAISTGIGGALLAFMLFTKAQKEAMIEKERKRELGKAKIGGRFELTDMNGVRKTSDDFKGKWLLIYFGFTHCPDICPDELEKMAKVIDMLKDSTVDLQPLFVSVDPARDTPEAIKAYLAEFHPEIVGLTGTPEELKKTSKSFRVYFSAGPVDQEEDYIVDHTVIMYLVGPDGDFIDYYGQNRTAKQIVDGIEFQKLKLDHAQKSLLGGLL